MAEKFLGVPYPITRHARGFFRSQGGLQQIKSDLMVLLLTNLNERVMLVEFGIDLERLLFEPNDLVVKERARAMIAEAIRRWEPRVAVSAITVRSSVTEDDLDPEDDLTQREHILYVSIDLFDPEQIEEVMELKLDIPL